MKTISELERLISNKKDELEKSTLELQRRKNNFSGETTIFKTRITELETELASLKATIKIPVIFPILIVAALVGALTAQFNLWTENTSIKIALWIGLGIAIVARIIVGHKLNAPCRPIKKEIKEAKNQITIVESADPNIARLEKEIPSLSNEIKKLENELVEAKLSEELTGALSNCILVHVKERGGVDPRRVLIDGCGCGNMVKPFKIIPIEPGVHSIGLEFIGLENHLQTKDVQFVTTGAPKFFCYDIKFDINKKWVVDIHQPATIDEFAKITKISKEKIKSYLLNL